MRKGSIKTLPFFWAVVIGGLLLLGIILAITFSRYILPLIERIFGG